MATLGHVTWGAIWNKNGRRSLHFVRSSIVISGDWPGWGSEQHLISFVLLGDRYGCSVLEREGLDYRKNNESPIAEITPSQHHRQPPGITWVALGGLSRNSVKQQREQTKEGTLRTQSWPVCDSLVETPLDCLTAVSACRSLLRVPGLFLRVSWTSSTGNGYET